MGTRETDPKAILMQHEDYRRLAEKHRRCEARLQELQGRHHLSDEEQLEEVRIKKEKLFLKDRMAAIERQVLSQRQAATG
ncbi:MAG: YdcH family protein [Candidatus Rokubacteria bacterium]|nr:YdcH family protein [Candidatus Rokubacteria bacterium]